MSEIKDGGAAFPQVDLKDSYGMLVPDRQPGMTLRDYFAAKAMQVAMEKAGGNWIDTSYSIAKHAYRQADAMLKARGQG
jgi:hypothetical protein